MPRKKDGSHIQVPIWEKTRITLHEATAYSGIGLLKLRNMTKEPDCDYVMWIRSQKMIIRRKFDDFINRAQSI